MVLGSKDMAPFSLTSGKKLCTIDLVSFLAALTSGEMLCLRCLTPFVDDIGEE